MDPLKLNSKNVDKELPLKFKPFKKVLPLYMQPNSTNAAN